MEELNQNMGGLKFGKDGDGNVGYYGADGSLIPFLDLESSYLSLNKVMNSSDYTLETSPDKSSSVSGTSSKSYNLATDLIQIIKDGMVLAKMEFTVKVTAYSAYPESNQDTSSASMNWYLNLSDGTTLESGGISTKNDHYTGTTRYQTKTSSKTLTVYPINYDLSTTEMVVSASGTMSSKVEKEGVNASASIIDIKLYYVNWE